MWKSWKLVKNCGQESHFNIWKRIFSSGWSRIPDFFCLRTIYIKISVHRALVHRPRWPTAFKTCSRRFWNFRRFSFMYMYWWWSTQKGAKQRALHVHQTKHFITSQSFQFVRLTNIKWQNEIFFPGGDVKQLKERLSTVLLSPVDSPGAVRSSLGLSRYWH